MLVLVTGVWLFHAPHWFVIGPNNVVGPGKEGIEYSTLLHPNCLLAEANAFLKGSDMEKRTLMHIFLCVLAYHLLVAIEKGFKVLTASLTRR